MKDKMKLGPKAASQTMDLKQWITDQKDTESTLHNPKERHVNNGGWVPSSTGEVSRLI